MFKLNIISLPGLFPALALASLIPRDSHLPASLRSGVGNATRHTPVLAVRQVFCPLTNEFLCSDGASCCTIGTFCGVFGGKRGCCPNGETCVANNNPCEFAGDLPCANDDFCCPAGNVCFRDSAGAARCRASGSQCEVAGDLLCANDDFCCPAGDVCFRDSAGAAKCRASGGGAALPHYHHHQTKSDTYHHQTKPNAYYHRKTKPYTYHHHQTKPDTYHHPNTNHLSDIPSWQHNWFRQ
ncbi:hypothetical protein BD779DRAFT_176880 [Infundibulicybe gibba]|nr:hypothetical protein BD779DRAFT_176880 [Infundibulicybe gibba]